ncbi:MAG: aldose epimerase family protein [Ferruginibacter sp.]
MLTGEPSTQNSNTDIADEIKLFTIENNAGTKLIVSNYGAAVQSLFVKDNSGKMGDVVLGYDDVNEYTTDDYYIGTVVGRFANRIAGGKVNIDGEIYQLSVKPGGFHHHGGFVGFNKKLFTAAPFSSISKRGVTFSYTSPHLEEGFPGELQLEVVYTLDDDDAWTVDYKAYTDRSTLINLTQHAYFNLSADHGATIDAHELRLLGDFYLPVSEMQVPTGEIAPVAGTPFDFTAFKTIGKDIHDDHKQLVLSNGYDHSFVFEKEHTSSLKHVAIVRESTSGRQMDVYTTEPSLHFYTGNFLENISGKQGTVYNKRSGFCLETQHFPDAPNHPHFPSTLLKAGEEYTSRTAFKFSTF